MTSIDPRWAEEVHARVKDAPALSQEQFDRLADLLASAKKLKKQVA
jgi:hypothetical protein